MITLVHSEDHCDKVNCSQSDGIGQSINGITIVAQSWVICLKYSKQVINVELLFSLVCASSLDNYWIVYFKK